MYESFYGLSAKPFQLSPDPEFFFGSRGHRRAMAYLEYGLHQAEGFIVVTGEVGAGKTTLVRQLLRRLPVRDGREPIGLLNELEYAHGLVLAKVWMDDRIAVIDPASGSVRAWLELGALTRGFARPPGFDPDEHVLNGIAHDPQRDRYYVTGKCWPVIYELEIPALPRLLGLPTENTTK